MIQNKVVSVNQSDKEADTITESDSEAIDPPLTEEYKHTEEKIEGQNYFRTLFDTGKTILPYPLVIMLNYVITFILFPGPCFSKQVGALDITWCVIIYNLAYNLGDTCGKYLAGMPGFFNHKALLYSFFLRLFFFLPITVMAVGADGGDSLIDNYFFPFFNMFLFAVTNGIVTSNIDSI